MQSFRSHREKTKKVIYNDVLVYGDNVSVIVNCFDSNPYSKAYYDSILYRFNDRLNDHVITISQAINKNAIVPFECTELPIAILSLDATKENCLSNLKVYYNDLKEKFNKDGMIIVSCLGIKDYHNRIYHAEKIINFCTENQIKFFDPCLTMKSNYIDGFRVYDPSVRDALEKVVTSFYSRKEKLKNVFSTLNGFNHDSCHLAIASAKQIYFDMHPMTPNFILERRLQERFPQEIKDLSQLNSNESCCRMMLDILQNKEGGVTLRSFKYLLLQELFKLKDKNLLAENDMDAAKMLATAISVLKSAPQLGTWEKIKLLSFWAPIPNADPLPNDVFKIIEGNFKSLVCNSRVKQSK